MEAKISAPLQPPSFCDLAGAFFAREPFGKRRVGITSDRGGRPIIVIYTLLRPFLPLLFAKPIVGLAAARGGERGRRTYFRPTKKERKSRN